MNFSAKGCKKWLISRKIGFGEKLQLLEQTTMSWHVSMNFSEKVAKSASFREKARKLIDLAKSMQLFRTNYHVLVFRWTFQQKVAKSGSTWKSTHPFGQKLCNFSRQVPHFVEKHEKSSIWPNLYNFCISINFSEKSCKKCLISWKNTKNHRFGQNLQFFKLPCLGIFMNFSERSFISWKSRRNHAFAKTCNVSRNFWQKVDKTASRKLIDLAKNYATFSKKPSCFGVSMNFSAKGCKKWLKIWPKFCNFSNKLACLCISMNFSGKSCKKCLRHFHQLFSNEVQKVPHFLKKHEKSSIWPTLCNFSNKLPCFCISMNF